MTAQSHLDYSHNINYGPRYLLALLSGAMSSVAFLNHDLYVFAWVCFVPLLFAINGVSLRHAYGLGLTAGFVNFLSATYWIMDFVQLSKGYNAGSAFLLAVLYWLYSAQIFGVTALLFSWIIRRTRFSPLIVFPIVNATVFATFPMLFPYRMGESQIAFVEILQGIELTGVFGLDSLIALFNVFVFCVLKSFSHKEENAFDTRPVRRIFLPLILILGWYVYGFFALSEWQSKVEQWPKQMIGLVQPNETPSTDRDKLYPGYMRGYPPEMAMTELLVKAGAEFVIWPEARYKGVLDYHYVEQAYVSHIERLGIPLMFQDIGEVDKRDSLGRSTRHKFNTAMMISPGQKDIQYYQKMKLIPFGESVPVVSQHSQLRDWLEGFLGEFLNEMTAGTSRIKFDIGAFNVIPLICYETVFPEFVANSLWDDDPSNPSNPKANVIVALSSNGWFGSSHQPYQHVMPSVLRAIESRTPFVHVVNNGPSVVVTPAGETVFTSDFQTAGGYVATLSYSPAQTSQPTLYGQYPNAFVTMLRILLVLLIVGALVSDKPKSK